MKTKTYDLNLYVVDGQLRVLAHELELSDSRQLQTGSNFTEALVIDVYRGNERQWRPILDLFEEKDLYSELDSWLLSEVADERTPVSRFSPERLSAMPIELARAVEQLPEYVVADHS